MTGKRITDLLDNAVIAAAEVGEWLLRRVRARDPQVRRAELSREALREVLVAAEEQRENWEPNEFWCNEHDMFCVHPQSGIPASGADASPPEKSGDSPSHQPSGGLSSSDLDRAAGIVRGYVLLIQGLSVKQVRDLYDLADRLAHASEAALEAQ